MKKWRCTICGYIHLGEAPPAECPVCGAGSQFFEELAADAHLTQASSLPGNQDSRSEIQQALFQVPCGLFVVCSFKGSKYNGMINNTVFQITDQPLQLLLGMDKRHLTTELIAESKVFSVNFLAPSQMEQVKHFGFQSGREIDKFVNISWRPGLTGVPLLNESPGFLECKMQDVQKLDAGTHWVFMAEIIAGSVKPGSTILTYQAYREEKKKLWS